VTSPSNLTQSGNSLTITNCTVTFNGGFDPSTGAAAITVTPTGNNASQLVSTLPGLVNGQPGQPAQFRNVNLTQIAYGTSLPSPAATVSTVSPGGAGVPALYDLNLNLNSGAPGTNGTSGTLGGASDLSGTATIQYAPLVSQTSPSVAFTYGALPFCVVSVPATINSTSGNSTTRTLCTASFAALPYPWYPWVSGSCIITGTANTRVDLWASLTTSAGQIVAYADGYTGDTGVAGPRVLAANLPTSLSLAKVPVNTTATIYFVAQQQNVGVTDNWSTAAATTRFTVAALPVSS
jgi:hypothetical protein